MKKLINRIKAEENKIGKILAYYIPSILVGIAGCGRNTGSNAKYAI